MTGSRLARAALVLPCAGLAVTAGFAFTGAFLFVGLWRMCLASAVVPALIAAAGLARRSRPLPLPLAATAGMSAVGWLVLVPAFAVAFAAPGSGAVAGGWPGLLYKALTSAPRQLLTTEPPVVPSAVLLAALGSLVWWATAWSAEAAVRAPEAGRTSMLPILPPLIVLALGTAAGVPRGSASQLGPAAGFAAAAVLLLAAQRLIAGRDAASGRVLIALGTTVLVVAIAVFAVPVLPGLAARPPADPRELVRPPPRQQSLLDPLGQVTAWLSGRPRVLFTVRTDEPANLTWLILSRYDGQEWTSAADYVPAGTVLPSAAGTASSVRTVTDQVRLTSLPGTWLPAAERPVRIAGVAARIDPGSGTLATLDGGSARGLDYQVTSAVPSPGAGQLANAVPGSGPALTSERVLPAGLPAGVAAYGTHATAGAASPYAELLQIQNRLLKDFKYNPRSAPGESYGLLSFFVGQHRTGGPGVFATLFAVLARRAGFATRLAVGFLPGRRTGPGQYTVTTADVLVWPEVYFTGLGWVPFYPLPKPGSGKNGAAIRPLGQPPSRTKLNEVVEHSQQHAGGVHHGPHGPRIPVVPKAGRVSALLVAGGAAGCLLVAMCLYLLAAALARYAVRRRWRRSPDPRQRVAAAWRLALSSLAAAAGRPLATLTPEEVAAEAAVVAGEAAGPPAVLLAGLVNAALFSPAVPAPADVAAADQAGGQISRLAKRRTSVRARSRGWLRLRPGYRGG